MGLIAAVATGCASDEAEKKGEQSLAEKMQGAIVMSPFSTCEDLEGYLKTEAKAQLELAMSYDFRGYPMPVTDDALGEPQAGAPEASGGDEGGGDMGAGAPNDGGGGSGEATGGNDEGPSGFTGTNNQEAEVDEADIVKTDGEYLYVLRASTLLIVDAWPAEQAKTLASVKVEGYPQQMFVQDDLAAVFSTVSVWEPGVAARFGLEESSGDTPVWSTRDLTKITLFDISDRSAPKVVRETYAQGYYVNARLVGQTARILVRNDIDVNAWGWGWGGIGVPGGGDTAVGVGTPAEWEGDTGGASEEFDAPSSSGSGGSANASSSGEDKADQAITEPGLPAETNPEFEQWLSEQKAAIDALPLDALLPRTWTATEPGNPESGLTETTISPCNQVYSQSVSGGLGYLTVVSVDLAAPEVEVPGVSLIGKGYLVYASADSLYVASDVWNTWLYMVPDASTDWQVTAIHKFGIGEDGGPANYQASGKVPGTILNQFALSQHEGHLRVASTRDDWTGAGESENLVTVLAQEGDGLVQTGQITGIAPGERIFSARFFGDKGYMVTFEQVDPLFTLDMSNPSDPRIVGELKIPGFSTYIHPLGEDHLLTIGQATEVSEWGGVVTTGVKLEIFDVSDFANPSSAHVLTLENGYYSEALYEHKAFTHSVDLGLLAIPVSGYGFGSGDVAVGGGSSEPGFSGDGDDGSAGGGTPGSSGGGSSEPSPGGEDSGSSDAGAPAEEEPTPPEEPGDEPQWVEPDYKVGLGVFAVDAVNGLSEHGFVDHGDFLDTQSWWGRGEVRRSVFIDSFVYSVSDMGLKVNAAADLSEVRSVTFPEDFGHDSGWVEDKPMPEPAIEVDDEEGSDEDSNVPPPAP
jgi:hypothetical protein